MARFLNDSEATLKNHLILIRRCVCCAAAATVRANKMNSLNVLVVVVVVCVYVCANRVNT